MEARTDHKKPAFQAFSNSEGENTPMDIFERVDVSTQPEFVVCSHLPRGVTQVPFCALLPQRRG